VMISPLVRNPSFFHFFHFFFFSSSGEARTLVEEVEEREKDEEVEQRRSQRARERERKEEQEEEEELKESVVVMCGFVWLVMVRFFLQLSATHSRKILEPSKRIFTQGKKVLTVNKILHLKFRCLEHEGGVNVVVSQETTTCLIIPCFHHPPISQFSSLSSPTNNYEGEKKEKRKLEIEEHEVISASRSPRPGSPKVAHYKISAFRTT